mmetsp:Transcript_10502/g.17299  ORF Transcript_10502/g.17299 Transcript_10502/m.17299 type:complete len:130 (-) Transcript_10502:70-459(-)
MARIVVAAATIVAERAVTRAAGAAAMAMAKITASAMGTIAVEDYVAVVHAVAMVMEPAKFLTMEMAMVMVVPVDAVVEAVMAMAMEMEVGAVVFVVVLVGTQNCQSFFKFFSFWGLRLHQHYLFQRHLL